MSEVGPFLHSAEARGTDLEILEAILYVAEGDEAAAERMWREPTNIELIEIFVILEDRGLDAEALRWGPLGYLWSRGLQELM